MRNKNQIKVGEEGKKDIDFLFLNFLATLKGKSLLDKPKELVF